jgi:hypothetical protein
VNERKGDTKSVIGRTVARLVKDQSNKLVKKRRKRVKSGAKSLRLARGKYTPRMKTNRRTDEAQPTDEIQAIAGELIEGFRRRLGARKRGLKGKMSGKQRVAVIMKLKGLLRHRKISPETFTGATKVKKRVIRKSVGKVRKPLRLKQNVRRRVVRKAGLEKAFARNVRHGVRTPFGTIKYGAT